MTDFMQVVNLADFLKQDLQKLVREDVPKIHAQIARQLKAEAVAQSPGSKVSTIVDGRRDASEDQVKPFGVIVYRFAYWRDVATWAIGELQKLSPTDSGIYRENWMVIVNGQEVGPSQIPQDATSIAITNREPYHRKIYVGAEGFQTRDHFIDKVAAEVRASQFGNQVQASIAFIDIPDPYILRKSGGRKDRAAGQPLTYPALILKPV
jgi:hypothetical protein